MATPQRPLGNRLITGGAGPDLPAAPSHNVEPHPQAGDESAEHQGAGQGASAAQSTTAPRMLVWATSLTTTPGLRRPRRAGRPPEPSTGPRRKPGQSGPARIPASLSRSSCCPVYTRPGGASSTSGSRPQGRSWPTTNPLELAALFEDSARTVELIGSYEMELTEAEARALLTYATRHELRHLERDLRQELASFERRQRGEVRSRDHPPSLVGSRGA